jgi:uncharacterized protein YqgC (DUF456 family)
MLTPILWRRPSQTAHEFRMNYLLATLLIALNAFWLFLVVLGLPGTWLMVGGTLLVAWWRHGAAGAPMFSNSVLVLICVLAVLGELLEFLAGAVGSKVVGGSKRGALGALIGAVVGGIGGTFLLPVLGSLVGTGVGAALGAWAFELHSGRAMRVALRSGAGAGVGRLTGITIKLVVGVLIWAIVAVAAFWP